MCPVFFCVGGGGAVEGKSETEEGSVNTTGEKMVLEWRMGRSFQWEGELIKVREETRLGGDSVWVQ